MIVELPQWLTQLREIEIVKRVQKDPRSVGKTVLGIAPNVAKDQVVGWGQADFDSPWNDLSPEDRVLLYAYFNQKGHLEELFAAFKMLFKDGCPNAPIVMDLGCGPFTGGLALAAVLGRESQFDYIGVDCSQTMRAFGERLASAAEQSFDEVPTIVCQWASDVGSVTRNWKSKPVWRPVIVIVSYLLASPTLNAEALVVDLCKLLKKIGRGPVTVLYTNSKSLDANRQYPAFRDALVATGFKLREDDIGTIKIERWGGEMDRKLRYALFHRQEQRTLQLGGG
ncbi:MAG: class I SAM-dependent methyltransferase [Nitrospira sp.]|nr:class I SAM-dependent methyltransferase [Nitrospira sp.]MDE0486644.1 class I SAM-dependent methyltransferase [Nitrospira sp.]